MKHRGWLLALALNGLVSLVVTWSVLAWWQHTHPCPPVSPAAAGPEASGAASAAAPQLGTVMPGPWFAYVVQPGDTWERIAARFGLRVDELQTFNGLAADAPLLPGQTLRVPGTPPPSPTVDPAGLEIVAVLGPGVLADEHVRLRNRGAQAVPLAGWVLEDDDGHRFVFPDVVLFPKGVLQVWTKAGTATVGDLYWGLDAPVWTSGERVTLRAPDGTVVATYRVP
ncbi:MAG: LysM peptidoglycan-binding domain-containing protein [Chloroflexi bacterium]|nr:LysM peptidoglycan-binding domain-containing protein [Chloroflexota bacterium]